MMKRIAQWAAAALSMILIVLACGKDDGPNAPEAKAPNIVSHTESGPVGSTLIINGTNFGASIAENTVTLNGTAVTLSGANTTKLTGEVPANATTGKIKVTTTGGSDTSEDDFEVTTGDGNTTLSLNKTTLTLYPYEHYIETLEATTNVDNPTINWNSSDTDVATVDENGEVTPLTLGTATITASINGVTAECVITVADGPVNSLEITPKEIELFRHDTVDLELTIEAEVESTGAAAWISDNEEVATVDEEGQVTAISPGEAEITVTVDNASTNRVITVKHDVIAFGAESDGSKNRAVVWKNGVADYLTNGNNNAEILAGFVDSATGDIYASGYESNGSKLEAKYWINGQETSLTGGNTDAKAHDIALLNGNVITVGYEMNDENVQVAKVWQDGNELYALTDGNNHAEALSIAIDSDNNIYSSGYEKNGNYREGKVWMNGNLIDTQTNGNYDIQISSIAIEDDVIGMCGHENDANNVGTAKLWIIGQGINLTEGDNNARAYDIFTGVENVYTTGFEAQGTPKAKYWKDLEKFDLTTEDYYSISYSVFVHGNIAYFSGYERSGTNGTINVATYWWRDGEGDIVTEELTDGNFNARAYDIVVR
ncbi:Ig-like domain-containing protein [Flagellimonas flava]|uniref:Ig-like domain-containing protein n=1 Tax=Flagellimonas flava TaxID=570519 RepID=UPI003D6627EF